MDKDFLTDMVKDPALVGLFAKLGEPFFRIPVEYEQELADCVKIEIPMLVTISSPQDYQVVLALLVRAQMMRERVVEIYRHIIALGQRWRAVQKEASGYLLKRYFTVLGKLAEHAKRNVMATALSEIETGVDLLESLANQAELVLKHYDQTIWNIKEMSRVVTEYLALLRYGSGDGVREI